MHPSIRRSHVNPATSSINTCPQLSLLRAQTAAPITLHHSFLQGVCICVQPKALDYSDELFESADTNKDDKLTLAELRALMNQASKRYSHLEEHARFLDA